MIMKNGTLIPTQSRSLLCKEGLFKNLQFGTPYLPLTLEDTKNPKCQCSLRLVPFAPHQNFAIIL